MTDHWGPIDPTAWREVPFLSGRLATEQDVVEGRAVFYTSNGGTVSDLEIPFCALMNSDRGDAVPVIAIQAEQAGDQIIVGVRFIHGGNGICTLPELQILEEPNALFQSNHDV
jgi:hypothetical protein